MNYNHQHCFEKDNMTPSLSKWPVKSLLKSQFGLYHSLAYATVVFRFFNLNIFWKFLTQLQFTTKIKIRHKFKYIYHLWSRHLATSSSVSLSVTLSVSVWLRESVWYECQNIIVCPKDRPVWHDDLRVSRKFFTIYMVLDEEGEGSG